MRKFSVVLMILFLLLVAPVYAQDLSEKVKIEYLIASIEALEGAKFIRNGHEYNTGAASSHLRLKLRAAGNKVRTAEDFIKICASKSSMTGEPYLMRFADGTTVKSEVFFRNKLNTFVAEKPY